MKKQLIICMCVFNLLACQQDLVNEVRLEFKSKSNIVTDCIDFQDIHKHTDSLCSMDFLLGNYMLKIELPCNLKYIEKINNRHILHSDYDFQEDQYGFETLSKDTCYFFTSFYEDSVFYPDAIRVDKVSKYLADYLAQRNESKRNKSVCFQEINGDYSMKILNFHDVKRYYIIFNHKAYPDNFVVIVISQTGMCVDRIPVSKIINSVVISTRQ